MLAESPSADAPKTIRVVPVWGGANRGAVRATGWTSVPLIEEARSGVVLHAGDESVPVAGGSLPAGRWDRVFIAVASVDAPDAGPIESHIEPIAFGLDASPNSEQAIELELIILDRPSRPGYWRIFVKDARITHSPSASVW